MPMALRPRYTPLLALLGMTLAGAPAARAQDTGAAARSDTPGYRAYPSATAPSDTVQPALRPLTDTGTAVRRLNVGGVPDTLVCTDSSNAPNGSNACSGHGGIDWTATQAALKARGRTLGLETWPDTGTAGAADSGSVQR